MKKIEEIDQFVLNSYNRHKILIERGEGVYLYSKDKKYLDFASGIGVCALGYGHKEFIKMLNIEALLHTSNLYYTNELLKASKIIIEKTGLGKVFFTNSGTEATEGALKLVKKYANDRGIHNHNIISMKNAFHGRSTGGLSLTYNKKYKDPFNPLLDNIRFAKFNNINSVKKACDKNTAAIILEPIQGEGGIKATQDDFLKKLKKYCRDENILLIFDEIQCGMGRSGKLFFYEFSAVKPDILLCAKGLGNGLPVGCFVVNDKLKNVLTPGLHGSTFGGNPLALRAVAAVFKIFEDEKILENVAKVSKILESSLNYFIKKYDFCLKQSGLGFMQGLKIDEKIMAKDIIKKSHSEGLLLLTCGKNQLRFLPPLIASEANISEMQEKLDKVLKAF